MKPRRMPKSMRENQRSYKVVLATGIDEMDFGRYIGQTVRDAARKALRQVLHRVEQARDATGKKPKDKALLVMRETTQWDRSRTPGKLYYFKGQRVESSRKMNFPGASSSFQVAYDYRVHQVDSREFQENWPTSAARLARFLSNPGTPAQTRPASPVTRPASPASPVTRPVTRPASPVTQSRRTLTQNHTSRK